VTFLNLPHCSSLFTEPVREGFAGALFQDEDQGEFPGRDTSEGWRRSSSRSSNPGRLRSGCIALE